MSLNATVKPKKLIPQGLHPARCFAIVDIGTHKLSFQGKPTLDKDTGEQLTAQKIMIFWEIPKFMITYKEGEKPQPKVIFQEYILSAGKKAKLPDVLKSWGPMKDRPTKISSDLLKKFVGHLCMLNIEHSKDGQYENVAGAGRGVNPFMKELPVPAKCKELVLYNLDSFTWATFNQLPPYAQKQIRACIEFSKITAKMPEPLSPDKPAEFTDTLEETTSVESEDTMFSNPEMDDKF